MQANQTVVSITQKYEKYTDTLRNKHVR